MSKETTYSGVMGELGRLSTALTANAPELAHLDGARLRLVKMVTDVDGLAQQQAALTASKQDVSQQLQKKLVEGRRLASGMTKLLQEFYGTRSEKLAEFGLQPFRGRKPRTAKTPEPPPTSTPPVATPAPTTAHPAADVNAKQ